LPAASMAGNRQLKPALGHFQRPTFLRQASKSIVVCGSVFG
jgi:hypothetical protein